MDIDSRIDSINTAAHLSLLRSHREGHRSSDGDLPLPSDVLYGGSQLHLAIRRFRVADRTIRPPTEYGRVESYYAWSGSGIT